MPLDNRVSYFHLSHGVPPWHGNTLSLWYTCVFIFAVGGEEMEGLRLKTFPIFWLSMNFPLDHINHVVPFSIPACC